MNGREWKEWQFEMNNECLLKLLFRSFMFGLKGIQERPLHNPFAIP